MDKPVSQMTPNEHVRYMQEQRILDTIERQQRFTSPSYQGSERNSASAAGIAPRSNGQPYFTPGGFHDAKEGVIAGIFAPVMFASFMAAGRKGATYPRAMLHALSMVTLWKTWAFTLLYWAVSGPCIWLWMGAEANQGDPATRFTTGKDVSFQAHLLVLHALLLLPAILLPYCQHVDSSFFKQRALYRVLRPIHMATSWIPWFVLQSLVLLPLLFIIQYRW